MGEVHARAMRGGTVVGVRYVQKPFAREFGRDDDLPEVDFRARPLPICPIRSCPPRAGRARPGCRFPTASRLLKISAVEPL